MGNKFKIEVHFKTCGFWTIESEEDYDVSRLKEGTWEADENGNFEQDGVSPAYGLAECYAQSDEFGSFFYDDKPVMITIWRC